MVDKGSHCIVHSQLVFKGGDTVIQYIKVLAGTLTANGADLYKADIAVNIDGNNNMPNSMMLTM